MRKLIMVMVELIILILFQVQGNDFMSPIFIPSLSIRFPHPSQLDMKVSEAPRPLYNCLEWKLKRCKKEYEPESTHFHECIVQNFLLCLTKNKKLLKPVEFNTYEIALSLWQFAYLKLMKRASRSTKMMSIFGMGKT
jgi:hypothetical protein